MVERDVPVQKAWVEITRTSTLMVAEAWKELFDAEAVIGRCLPAGQPGERATYIVLVPTPKLHVAQEVLRKL